MVNGFVVGSILFFRGSHETYMNTHHNSQPTRRHQESLCTHVQNRDSSIPLGSRNTSSKVLTHEITGTRRFFVNGLATAAGGRDYVHGVRNHSHSHQAGLLQSRNGISNGRTHSTRRRTSAQPPTFSRLPSFGLSLRRTVTWCTRSFKSLNACALFFLIPLVLHLWQLRWTPKRCEQRYECHEEGTKCRNVGDGMVE